MQIVTLMRPLKCKEHAKSDVFCVTPLKRPLPRAPIDLARRGAWSDETTHAPRVPDMAAAAHRRAKPISKTFSRGVTSARANVQCDRIGSCALARINTKQRAAMQALQGKHSHSNSLTQQTARQAPQGKRPRSCSLRPLSPPCGIHLRHFPEARILGVSAGRGSLDPSHTPPPVEALCIRLLDYAWSCTAKRRSAIREQRASHPRFIGCRWHRILWKQGRQYCCHVFTSRASPPKRRSTSRPACLT